MKKFELPEDLRQDLLNYLSQKPWREVEGAMHALMGLKQIGKEGEIQGNNHNKKEGDE